jgi:hypothetical protein
MTALYVSFDTKSLFGEGKFVHNIYGNPNSSRADKILFPNLYKLHNLYILMDFYLVLLREVCTRSSQLYGCSMKRPLLAPLLTSSMSGPFRIGHLGVVGGILYC